MSQKIILIRNVIPKLIPSQENSQLSLQDRKRKEEIIEDIQPKKIKLASRLQVLKEKNAVVEPKPGPSSECYQKSSSSSSTASTSSAQPEFSSSSEELNSSEYLRKISVERTLLIIENHSRFYLGLPKEMFFLVKLLENESKINYRNILVIIKKIRLNDPYYRLALDFSLSVSTISRIFGNSLIKLASYMEALVYWPSAADIKLHLPIPFRARYQNVQSIIDCFEIEIEQPSKSLHQTLTWSEYKKCNTLKYLISATPDGVVNFVSSGFGGRTSDTEIVKESGYLDRLPNHCLIMADRGFKHIESFLNKKNCLLVRPPSVSVKEKLSKKEVKLNKRIASLRIHIERVIRRLREFDLLAPHACIDIKFAWKLDFAVKIACGIINMQGPLLKTE